jgi:putative thioredoxin
MNNNDIQEISEVEFEEKVILASTSSLILVDFWAPWCGPCKQLTPSLEKVTISTKGKVKLIKINIDENQQIANQMGVQSIPAVFAFKNGKPVDAFQGVIAEKKIIEFIEKSLGEKILENHSEFYNEIDSLISKKDFDTAKNSLEDFIANNPNEYQAFALYISCLGELEMYSEAEGFSNSLTKEALSNNFIKSSLQKITIKRKNSQGPSLEDLINAHSKKPKNIDGIVKLADKYFASDMLDESFELLLKNYKENNNVIKKKILEYFDALGNSHEKTIGFRKKFSSIMFS